MVDRATNIKIKIDIKDAMGKISQMKQGMNSLGATGQQSGQQIQQGMNKARGAIDAAGNSAVKNAVNFQTMGQGMLNLSTAGVQTFTSISNLARAENRAEAASLGLQRAQDLLARKTLAYNKIVESGNGASREAKLLLNEMETATNDLAVKTDKLKIEQEAVTDVYLLFGANLMNVGVSSLMIYKSMMDGVTKASALNSLMTAKNTIATKLNALAKWNSSKSLIGFTAASATATGGLVKSTIATKAATVATKLFNLALGPVGLIIIGITAALTAYETNFMGFKDSINGFLGIQEEFNEGVDDGTGSIEEQTQALNDNKKAFEDLTIPMQNYITMQEKMARQNNDPRELLRLAKFRGAQGFSPGGGTTQQVGGIVSNGSGGGNTAFDSANKINKGSGKFDNGSFVPSAYGDTSSTSVDNKVLSQKPAIASDFGKNPFGNIDQKIAFYEQSYAGQRDTLLSWIDNTWDNPGMQEAFIKKYWEIYDISDGFKDQKSEAMNPVDELNAQLQKGYTGIPKKSVFAPGFGGQGSIFNFKLDNNRDIIKDALGVDIGAIANTVNITDGIRFATNKLIADSFQGQGGRGAQAISAFGGNATEAYQARGSIGTAEWRSNWRQELRERDSFVNAGGQNLITRAREIFQRNKSRSIGGSFKGGRANWSYANVLARYTTTRINAPIFGSDEESLIQLEKAEKDLLEGYENDLTRAALFSIQAAKIADDRINRVEQTLSDGLGIDFDANSKVGTYKKYGGSKNRPLYTFNSTAKDLMSQIREDIGASSTISIPSAGRLESIALAFNENGSFSNFNNRDITGLSKEKLGMTEQAIFDIRFDHTRGDRELLNRIRYIEKIEAASSGTSPL